MSESLKHPVQQRSKEGVIADTTLFSLIKMVKRDGFITAVRGRK